MILIKEVKEIDERCIEALLPRAKQEMLSDLELSDWVLKHSTQMWEVWAYGIPSLIVGIIPLSLIGGGNRIWCLPCHGLHIHNVAVARALKKIYMRKQRMNLTAFIKVEEYTAKRFARFFRFKPVGERVGEFELYRAEL
jgi:hypothetical protein